MLRAKSYCACQVSRDLLARVKNYYIFGVPDAILSIHYTTLMGRRGQLKALCK